MKRINLGGLFLVLFGVLFLLDNLGIPVWNQLWQFWPLLLVAAGVAMLVRRD